jgi:hypothetical protein
MKKTILILTLINFSNLSFSQVPNYVPTNGLIGWWPFSGNANDLSGNGNNGIVSNSVQSSDRFGTTNSSYYYDGNNDYIKFPTNILSTAQASSISIWVLAENTLSRNIIFSVGDSTGIVSTNGNHYSLELYDENSGDPLSSNKMVHNVDRRICQTTNNPYRWFSDTSYSVQSMVWNHIVLTSDGTQTKYYRNGIEVTNLYQASPLLGIRVADLCAGINYFWLGKRKRVGEEFFMKGKLDDLGMWNRVLTNCEVLDLYNSQLGVLPTITASGSTSFCQGGSVVLTSSSNIGNTWSNGSTSQSITVSNTGTYTVNVSNGNCSYTSLPISVSVNQVPSVPTIFTTGPTAFCQGGSVQLTSSTNSGNTWSNGSTSQSITVSNSGTYTVTASNGICSSTSLPISISVNATPPVPSIFISGPTTFCQGGSVQLTSSTNSGNTWSNGSTSQSITVSNSGTYTVTSSNGNCTSTSLPLSVTVNSNPTVTMTPIGNFININENPIGLVGNPSGGSFSGNGVNGSVFNPQIAGLGISNVNYNYTNISGCNGNAIQSTIVYDTTGTICTSFDTIQVTINDTIFTSVTDTLIINTTLGLPAPNNENTISIYPNPASNYLTIDNGNYSAMSGYTIKIENNAGQQVFQSVINQEQFIIDLSTWTGDGLYFVHLIDAQGNTVTIRKIVLQ